ncbi:MAG: hypothetical protein PUF27_05780, partial [Bacteroidales bacterium]|nr:hypothetical protein [Bacteroidales bacterium]
DIGALDHKSAVPYWVVALFLAPLTLGIFPLVWWSRCVAELVLSVLPMVSALLLSGVGTFWVSSS